uniref:WD40-like Beta Propeller Repeat n=3 Tax=unclassified Prevotella TaxID=2638335 RepID=A0AB33J7B5_9BACT
MISYKNHTTKLVSLLLLILLGTQPMYAQKKRKRIRQTPQKEVTHSQSPLETMPIAKVMFVDSIVVDFKDFIQHIPLNTESGKLLPYNSFFATSDEPTKTIHINEFGNHCYYAKGDSTNSHLYTKDKLGNIWENEHVLDEIPSSYQSINYPFMCTDGLTLFFAAKGSNSIGGYDVFMTRYNNNDGHFYQPENYGLPYNSEFNDYLIAIDDIDSLGWLVTDRYQPEGKVCIYTFVPTSSRINIDTEQLSKDEKMSYAQLNSIEKTWTLGDRTRALARIEGLKNKLKNLQTDTNDIAFVINDNMTYHSISDFRSQENKKLFRQLLQLKKDYQANILLLENRVDSGIKDNSLYDLENKCILSHQEIHALEKKIRNTENILINK